MDHQFKNYTHNPNTKKISKLDCQIAFHYVSTHQLHMLTFTTQIANDPSIAKFDCSFFYFVHNSFPISYPILK